MMYSIFKYILSINGSSPTASKHCFHAATSLKIIATSHLTPKGRREFGQTSACVYDMFTVYKH